MFLPVNESSGAKLHLFSSKNKQCFAYYLYLAYKWGSGTNFLFKAYFKPHHLPLLTPQHPFFSHHLMCFCVHQLQSPHQNQNLRQGGWRVGPQLATQDLRKKTQCVRWSRLNWPVQDIQCAWSKDCEWRQERVTGNCGVTLRRDQQVHVRDFVVFLDGPSIHITATQQLQCVAVLKPDQWLCRVPWCGVKVAKSPRAIFRNL